MMSTASSRIYFSKQMPCQLPMHASYFANTAAMMLESFFLLSISALSIYQAAASEPLSQELGFDCTPPFSAPVGHPAVVAVSNLMQQDIDNLQAQQRFPSSHHCTSMSAIMSQQPGMQVLAAAVDCNRQASNCARCSSSAFKCTRHFWDNLSVFVSYLTLIPCLADHSPWRGPAVTGLPGSALAQQVHTHTGLDWYWLHACMGVSFGIVFQKSTDADKSLRAGAGLQSTTYICLPELAHCFDRHSYSIGVAATEYS